MGLSGDVVLCGHQEGRDVRFSMCVTSTLSPLLHYC